MNSAMTNMGLSVETGGSGREMLMCFGPVGSGLFENLESRKVLDVAVWS